MKHFFIKQFRRVFRSKKSVNCRDEHKFSKEVADNVFVLPVVRRWFQKCEVCKCTNVYKKTVRCFGCKGYAHKGCVMTNLVGRSTFYVDVDMAPAMDVDRDVETAAGSSGSTVENDSGKPSSDKPDLQSNKLETVAAELATRRSDDSNQTTRMSEFDQLSDFERFSYIGQSPEFDRYPDLALLPRLHFLRVQPDYESLYYSGQKSEFDGFPDEEQSPESYPEDTSDFERLPDFSNVTKFEDYPDFDQVSDFVTLLNFDQNMSGFERLPDIGILPDFDQSPESDYSPDPDRSPVVKSYPPPGYYG